jgi:hypothetical protein
MDTYTLNMVGCTRASARLDLGGISSSQVLARRWIPDVAILSSLFCFLESAAQSCCASWVVALFPTFHLICGQQTNRFPFTIFSHNTHSVRTHIITILPTELHMPIIYCVHKPSARLRLAFSHFADYCTAYIRPIPCSVPDRPQHVVTKLPVSCTVLGCLNSPY